MSVPFLTLDPAYRELRDDLDAAAARVMGSGRYVLGAEVEGFERRFAEAVGTRHAVGVGSGLDALHLALRAMGVGPGDEVIVPSSTFVATWLAVTYAGATPVPAEPDPETYLIDPDRVEAALTRRTRAIVPVHLYGAPADTDALGRIAERHGLWLLEDAAQAHGARLGGRPAGSLGHAAAWSFYPGKNLGGLGDGGAVTTDDDGLAERLRRLRNYGSSSRYRTEERGFNSRLDEIQAALLSVKLAHLEEWNARRTAVASRYDAGLAGTHLALPRVRAGCQSAWHLYVVRSPGRDVLQEALRRRGVETLIHYPVPPHLQPAYDGLVRPGALPIAERLAREVLSLPMGPHLDESAVEEVIGAVHDALGA